jgi:hypothetical protein
MSSLPERLRGRSELGVSVLLAALGALVGPERAKRTSEATLV